MTTKGTSYINDYNRRRKRLMLKGFGGKCQICGYDKCITALEFHHINPEEKDITLSSSIYSWDKTKEELKKCICVCANCHREIHEGLIEIEQKQYFNESLVQDYNPQYKKDILYDKCPVCGKLKLFSRKFCSQKCACYQRRKVNWSKINLLDIIDNKKISITDISKKLGCSWTAVKKRYKRLKGQSFNG